VNQQKRRRTGKTSKSADFRNQVRAVLRAFEPTGGVGQTPSIGIKNRFGLVSVLRGAKLFILK